MVKQKLIVTHYSPDLDAIGAVWILKTFHPDFAKAKVDFVAAGEKLAGKEDQEVVHVDTGGGPFDHHQHNKFTCATKLVWEWVKKERELSNPAIERLVELVTEVDHAKDLSWPEASNDRYELCLPQILDGWKMVSPGQNEKFVDWGMIYFDGLYRTLKAKIQAEESIAKNGIKFKTSWGNGLAVESGNDKILDVAEKQGFAVVIRKDKQDGMVRIYGRADKKVDLREAYQKCLKADPKATWYLHPSNCMLLNGSRKKPGMRPSTLTLKEVVKILEES